MQARAWVLSAGPLTERLAAQPCERARRTWLTSCPGLGPKSASWVLRNTGWAQDLAILDVHVLRAMSDAGLIGESGLKSSYEAVERTFLDSVRPARCRACGVRPVPLGVAARDAPPRPSAAVSLLVCGGTFVEAVTGQAPRIGGSGFTAAVAAARYGAEVSLASWVGSAEAEVAFALLDSGGGGSGRRSGGRRSDHALRDRGPW